MYASDSNGGNPGFVTVISSASNTKIATIAVGSGLDQSVFNPANTNLYVLNADSDSVSVIGPRNTVIATITSASCTLPPPDCHGGNGNGVQDQQSGNSNNGNQCQQQDQNQNQASPSRIGDSNDFTMNDLLKPLSVSRD